MAKKWSKKEINEYLGTKQISQENYVAPTVQTNYTPSVENDNVIRSVASTIDSFNSVKPAIEPIQTKNTITDTSGNVQVLEQPNKSFGFSIDNKKKTVDDYKKERDTSYDKLMEYKKEKGINLFNEKKYKNDKTYQELLKDTQSKQKEYDNALVNKNTDKVKKTLEENKNIGGTIAKLGIASAQGFTKGVGGIESTARKLTGQVNEDERQKYELFDPMHSKALETASKPEQLAMGIVGSWSQMMPQMLAGNPTSAKAIGFANYGGSAYNDAKKDGATEDQATKFGIATGSLEMMLTNVLGGFESVYGKSALGSSSKTFVNNVMNRLIKNEAVRKTLSGMKGEFTEEYLQEFLEPILKNVILKEDNGADFWNTMKDDLGLGLKQLGSQLFNKQNLEAGLQGALSSGLLEGPQNFAIQSQAKNNNMTMDQYINAVQNGTLQQEKPLEQTIRENLAQEEQQNVSQMIEQPQIPTQTPLNEVNQGVLQQNNQMLGQEQTPQITPLNQVNQELQETRQNDIANQVQAMNLEQEPQFTQKQGNYVYEKSDNSKIDNLRKDAANYLKEGEQTTNFVNTLEKLVKDKDIEIRFDTKLGNNVNGTYKNGVITINPNSNRAGEFVAIHELTHAIGTKPMIDMIQTYRKSNAEFNNAVERLLSTYKTTEINEEALGDIAGQLFGNQEYINNLSMENPSLFKKIYNEIKYLWHQFTGYKNQDQFIEDLRNKWESAYRNQKIQQKAKNSNIEMSTQIDSNGNMLSNEQVDYFKNSKVRDENGNLLEVYHGTNSNDFTVFDKSKFNTNESSGDYIGEGFYFTKNKGTASRYGTNIKPAYLKIENPVIINNAQDGKTFRESFDGMYEPTTEEEIRIRNEMRKIDKQYDYFQLKKENPALIREELEKRGYDGLIDNDYGQYAVFNSNQIKNIDNLTPTQDDDIRYSKNEELDNSSFLIENNNDIEKLNMPKSPYQTLRPNVRGGWNIDKIQKQLKNESSNRVNSKELSKFDNLDDLMNNVYYHGSISAHDNLKAGSTLQENQRTGGYGAEYHSISLSGNKNIASNFASMGQNGTVMPVILKKNANVIEMPNIEDSIELEDILPDLWNKGVDAVKIGDWDIETKGYGEQELVILNPRAIMTMPQGTTYFQNYHKPKFQNMTKEEILETLTKTKERALNDPKLKPGQAEEIESRYDKLIKYSKDNQTWREYLEKEFPSQGTRTNLQDINERNKPKQENKTTQEEKPQEMPKKEVKQEVKKSYLTSAEQNELDGLKAVENSGFAELTKEEQARMEELEKKSQGITKKFPELSKTVTQEDTKPLYFKYKDSEISRENNKILNEAKNIVEANNQGRRTKEQWLQVAEYIGSNADIKNSTDLQKLAMETWLASRPNTKDNLNRQGKKYVDFKTNEWFNAMYKGAGVGTDVKLSQEERNTINESKQDEVAVLRTPTEIQPKEVKTPEQKQEYFEESGTPKKVAKILSETPRETETSSLREKYQTLKRAVVDKGEAIYRIAKQTKNRRLYAMYDRIGLATGEGNSDIGISQTNLDGESYKNFTDSKGNKTSMSLNDIWKDVEDSNIPESVMNEYLAHYLNVDRYKPNQLSMEEQQELKELKNYKNLSKDQRETMENLEALAETKNVFGDSVTREDSLKKVKEIEEQYPQIKRPAENIWQYGKNQLQKMVDAGLVSKESQEYYNENTPHYVRLQRSAESNKGSVFDDRGHLQVNNQIKKAKGGTKDIIPFKDSMAQYTLDTTSSIRKNLFGQELSNTLKNGLETDGDIDIDNIDNNILNENEDGSYTFKIFKDGKPEILTIDKGIYEALQPNKHYELEKLFTPFKAISNFKRTVLTDKNPLFLATNFFKDFFDAPLNTKHSTVDFVKNYGVAINQILKNGEYYQKYQALGGNQNTYFDKEGFSKPGKLSKLVAPIEKANEFIELLPRMSEFITSLKKGESLDEAMYNAAEITTNFKRGGTATKIVNRNGATFLNASVQGFDKQIRNFTEIENPKQAARLLTKALVLGVAPALLNAVMYDDDDEYEDLPDYVKDSYYLFKTGKDNKWIRIPKGRAISVIQAAARRTYNYSKGDKDAYKGLAGHFENQLAPNNPLESNVLSPLVDVKNNKAWSGNKIVSDSIANASHPEEEYDAKTDELSKWLGQKLGKSPKKINYIIDQNTGAIGDLLLPFLTKQAEGEDDSVAGRLLKNPVKDKFTTDAVLNSKQVNQFYDAFNKAEDDKKWSKATDEDKLKYKYLYSTMLDLAEKNKQIKQIESSDKSDKEKYRETKAIKQEMNDMSKKAVKESENIKINDYYAQIDDKVYKKEYDKSTGEYKYTKVQQKQLDKIKDKGVPLSDYFQEAYEKQKKRATK